MRKVRSVLPTRDHDSIEDSLRSWIGDSKDDSTLSHPLYYDYEQNSDYHPSRRKGGLSYTQSDQQFSSQGQHSPYLGASSKPGGIIDLEIEQLRSDISELKGIVESMMDESHSYAIKYTRRILIINNTLIAIYALGKRLYDLVYTNKGTILNPFTYISIFKSRKSSDLLDSQHIYSRSFSEYMDRLLNKIGRNTSSQTIMNRTTIGNNRFFVPSSSKRLSFRRTLFSSLKSSKTANTLGQIL